MLGRHQRGERDAAVRRDHLARAAVHRDRVGGAIRRGARASGGRRHRQIAGQHGEHEQVRRAGRISRDDPRGRVGGDPVGHRVGWGIAQRRPVERGDTSHVRRRERGPGQDRRQAAEPGRLDVLPRRVDADAGAPIREIRLGVVPGRRRNGEGAARASGLEAGVAVVVGGGRYHEDPGVPEVVHRRGQRDRRIEGDRQVYDCGTLVVCGHPIHAPHDIGQEPDAAAVEIDP